MRAAAAGLVFAMALVAASGTHATTEGAGEGASEASAGAPWTAGASEASPPPLAAIEAPGNLVPLSGPDGRDLAAVIGTHDPSGAHSADSVDARAWAPVRWTEAPDPGTGILLATGLVGLGVCGRRREATGSH